MIDDIDLGRFCVSALARRARSRRCRPGGLLAEALSRVLHPPLPRRTYWAWPSWRC
jgi:hypothetical protein